MNAAIAERREEVKLDIMISLARSQRALSVILESMAQAAAFAPANARDSLAQLEALVRYQAELAHKLCGLPLREVKISEPGLPWINEEERVAGPFAMPIRQ